ncbi:MAG: class I SAM-dependent methyltransferase [Planctomycetes bacterium]|nr:class I SAM-dependent methyltransferase [Planctomycetota bacterium]
MEQEKPEVIANGPSIDEVRDFWQNNPLFSGEASSEVGSKEYFEEHRKVYIEDCLAGVFDERFIPPTENRGLVLDLGCGPGMWSVELQIRGGANKLVSADLTEKAVELCAKRLQIYGLEPFTEIQNAESLTFETGKFDHVNCQGVIHHTPNTENCVSEIARVLKPGGTACISVYYRNVILRNWWLLRIPSYVLFKLGARLKGRGRETIFAQRDIDDIVRYYDGSENPIGKMYTKKQFREMIEKHFVVEEIYYHFFPRRALPFWMPKFLHRFLDRRLPFMIYATLRKPF